MMPNKAASNALFFHTVIIIIRFCCFWLMIAMGRQKLDINTASVDEFASLSGIGQTKAKAIIDLRNVSIFVSFLLLITSMLIIRIYSRQMFPVVLLS